MIKRILKFFLGLVLLLCILIGGLVLWGPMSISSIKAILNVAVGYGVDAPAESVVAQRLQVPDGFSVGRYAEDLPKIRFIEFSNAGDLLAVQSRDGLLVLLKRDKNSDGRHDGKTTILDNLNNPNDLEFFQEWLYVAEKDAIGRLPFDQQTGTATGPYERLITGLPDTGNHTSKSIRIHRGKLFVSIGSSCNVCVEEDERRATIMEFDLDGKNGKIIARGLRNSVGLDVAPWNNQLYATDNGRDLLGDDYPVCELNEIHADTFYGWPYINAFGDLDPDFGEGQEKRLETSRSPVFGFAPHNAPLGMRFLKTTNLPENYGRTALVAMHGSWNRSKLDGYKVVSLHWQNDNSITSREFLSGFEKDDDVIGRPVDIAEGPDGCAYISDDYAGSIYRVCYGQTQNTLTEATTSLGTDIQWQALNAGERNREADLGQKLFADNNCSECHSINGSGNESGKALDQLNKRYHLDDLTAYFLSPNPPMPVFELSEAERRRLAIYLLSESP